MLSAMNYMNNLPPNILLPESVSDKTKEFSLRKKKKYQKKVLQYPKVDINEADTASFKRLYGIGEFLAEMIVK